MKNKILLTVAIALIGLLGFSTTAEANPGHGNRHKHVFYKRGNRVVVWHNNHRQCNTTRYGNRFYNGRGYRMCGHMSNIWNGGRCGNAVVRCNSRGCGMFGMTYRNGNFFNGRRSQGHGYHSRHGQYKGRNNRGVGRGNGRYNQGGRGNGRSNGGGTGRGNGNGRGNSGGRNGGR